MTERARFWEDLPIEALTRQEWEALCDGCGRCCLLKLEDEDTGEIQLTRLSCRLLDIPSCRCSNYEERHRHVPDCVTMTPQGARALGWLPPTCAYRLRAEGKPLAWWHPLVSGDPETVHAAGISVRGFANRESPAKIAAIDRYFISAWPEARRQPGRSDTDDT